MHLNKNKLPTFIRSSSLEDYHVTLRAVSLSLGTLGSDNGNVHETFAEK